MEIRALSAKVDERSVTDGCGGFETKDEKGDIELEVGCGKKGLVTGL